MRIPAPVRTGVEALLSDHTGRPARLTGATPVGGGCVSSAARIQTSAGDVAFLKWDEADPSIASTAPGPFGAEATALQALEEAGAVRVPRVLGVSEAGSTDMRRGECDDAYAPASEGTAFEWLLLEWLEPGRPTAHTWRRLGDGLARLHGTSAERYGWAVDNYIARLPQPNGWRDAWPAFWRERRLVPQIRRAVDGGHFSRTGERRRFDRLLDRLDDVLAPATADGPSLLHGDLWGGNVHVLLDGSRGVVDPASYYGHREVDLAMSELFGGFDADFYRAYEEAWPLRPGYRTVRRPIYQLYYLVVHVNLFGSGYTERTLRALAETGV